ncbi:MAG: hypothetical protein H0V07_10700 [Propionibacteriales bacterium]|nr:hypothetical protein [Propionibacteriales bacterium]
MTPLAQPTKAQALRRAAVRATLAASVHNTQPWRFVLGGDALEIYADQTRRLLIVDPAGRQMLISCGCALFNARVSLASAGYRVSVERFPDPARPEVLARLSVDVEPIGTPVVLPDIGTLDPVIELRRTNRRHFADDTVPEDVINDLIAAAAAECAELVPISRPDDRLRVATLTQRADAHESADLAYRVELREWTSNDPARDDGVPSIAVPAGQTSAHDDLPIRDFDFTRAGSSLPAPTGSTAVSWLLLVTADDNPGVWLQAGEALQHVLLEVARHGYAASPFTQAIEVPQTRAMLRQKLRLTKYPHVLLRVGRAPPTPATRRRRLVDMLVDSA